MAKITDLGADALAVIQHGDFSEYALKTFLLSLANQTAFLRSCGSYREGKIKQEEMINGFITAVLGKIKELEH